MHGTIRIPALLALAASVAVAQDGEAQKPDFEPWSKIGKDMETTEGLWPFHQDKKKKKFWVEVPANHLDKPFLMATSIGGGTTMRGWQWNDWLLVWQLHDTKLVLLERNVGFKASKAKKPLTEAIEQTYTDRVLGTYPVIGKGAKGGFVLDGERFFAQGASLFFGGMGRSKDASLAKFDASKNFPENSEVRVTLPSSDGTLITLAYSLSLLKPNPAYKPREADDRIGYFTTVLKDFSEENKDENRMVRFCNRWHLEKEDASLKLSPPKKRIEFFIEKTVPVRLQRYVKDGILEWNKAFEKVGFLDAIVVYQQTETNEHKDKDPEDIRYNFFRWIYSDNPFAMGPSRVDPQTGQILDADILFDDSYIRWTLREYRMQIKEVPSSLLRAEELRRIPDFHPLRRLGVFPAHDEFLDAIPDDAARPHLGPHARRAFCSIGHGAGHQLACASLWFKGGAEGGNGEEWPEELIGQFVKDTVMHEVGHTLGLRHNFKASILRASEDINSEAKPEAIAGSVMDYNPLVVAPEGRPQGNYAMTTIGPYDYWAIEYGYTPEDKKLPEILSRCAEPGHDYATDEDTASNDPYVNRWDLGKDPLAYGRERVALMKRLRTNLEDRAVDKGERYHRLRQAMNMQFYEARNAGRLAVRFVGGEQLHRDHRGDPGARPPILPVPAEKQREAIKFVCEEFLSGRYFDFPPELLRKLAPDFHMDDFLSFFLGGAYDYPYLDNVLSVQMQLVAGMTSPSRLNRVLDMRHKTPAAEEAITAPEVFDALQAAIFGDLKGALAGQHTNQKPALTAMQRNLQREYVAHLIYILLEGEGWYPAPIQTLARHYVKSLAAQIRAALPGPGDLDTYTQAHLDECLTRLERALDASYSIPR